MTDKTLGKARGLNSIADPSDFKGVVGRRRRDAHNEPEAEPRPETSTSADMVDIDEQQQATTVETQRKPAKQAASRPSPDPKRKRRELSVPHEISDALERTSINPADIVMGAYRKHGDAIYGGAGGRPVSRGRARLRLSLTDADFDKVIRLGSARGWNRSETVAVLVAFELLPDTMNLGPTG